MIYLWYAVTDRTITPILTNRPSIKTPAVIEPTLLHRDNNTARVAMTLATAVADGHCQASVCDIRVFFPSQFLVYLQNHLVYVLSLEEDALSTLRPIREI